MDYELLLVEQRGAIAVLSLNRPKALNALNRQLIRELDAAVKELVDAGGTRALVLTGSGEKAFCAGADIGEMSGLKPLEAAGFSEAGHLLGQRIEMAPFPTIAAVNGLALGGGCELALACDFIYAAQEAKLGQPEVNLGLIPGFGGCTRLVRRVGVAWARELVLTGDLIPAPEALRVGLVNRVFPRADLLENAVQTAQRIAERGPVAVSLARRLLLNTQDMDLARANAAEQNAFGVVVSSEDAQEGMVAFQAKRPPQFKGR
jgi:enoyl-CoA hydratase